MEAIIISLVVIYYALPNKATDYFIDVSKKIGGNEKGIKDENAFMLIYNRIMGSG